MSKLLIQRFHSRKSLYHQNFRHGKMFNAVADAATLAVQVAGRSAPPTMALESTHGNAENPPAEATLAPITIIFGIALVGVGLFGFFGTGAEHKTALIPAFLGLPLILLGLLALKDSLRKHAMH